MQTVNPQTIWSECVYLKKKSFYKEFAIFSVINFIIGRSGIVKKWVFWHYWFATNCRGHLNCEFANNLVRLCLFEEKFSLQENLRCHYRQRRRNLRCFRYCKVLLFCVVVLRQLLSCNMFVLFSFVSLLLLIHSCFCIPKKLYKHEFYYAIPVFL